MTYDFIAIPDEDVPQATDPLFQQLVATYASETNKTASKRKGHALHSRLEPATVQVNPSSMPYRTES